MVPMKEEKTERLSIRISKETQRRLRMAAAKRNIRLSQYVLEALAWRLQSELENES